MSDFSLTSFGTTHLGLARGNNEDAFAALDDKRFFIVADGMGGHLAGEVAAATALESLCEQVCASPPMGLEKTCFFFRVAFAKANSLILKKAAENVGYKGMGTTLSCFFLTDQHLIYTHIGDTRLYRYRRRLLQLTSDHSLRQKVSSGNAVYSNRHLITRALGINPVILPDVGIAPLHSKDLYLLCSDGLSDYVQEEVLSQVLAAPSSLQEKGEILIKTALEKGGRDNITLLLVQMA